MEQEKVSLKDYVCPYLHFLCHLSGNYQTPFYIDRVTYNSQSVNQFLKNYYPKLELLTDDQVLRLQEEVPNKYATICRCGTKVHILGIVTVNESL